MKHFVPWHERAACATHDTPDLWTELPPPMTSGTAGKWGTGEQKRAIRICRSCPVLVDCLKAALAEEGGVGGKHRYGIRGGLTPNQRAKVDAERQRRGLVA